jgi:hypothetical protein
VMVFVILIFGILCREYHDALPGNRADKLFPVFRSFITS